MSKTDELERAAEHHRAQIAAKVGALTDSVSPQATAKKAIGQTSDLGQAIVNSALNGAKSAPTGLALVGIGVALIALNANKKSGNTARADHTLSNDMAGHDARIARADARIKSRETGQSDYSSAGSSSTTLRQALDKGLDRLSPEARARVADARLKAIEAQEKVEQHARRAAKQARDAHNAQPFLTGAIVAGIGALIGALLPSTRAETNMMGATRDKLMRDAEAVMREEFAKLEKQATSAVQSGLREAQNEFTASSSSSR